MALGCAVACLSYLSEANSLFDADASNRGAAALTHAGRYGLVSILATVVAVGLWVQRAMHPSLGMSVSDAS